MRNISQYPKAAASAIKEISEALKLKKGADYGDWLFAMMRSGFTKDEALKEFNKLGFKLQPDSKIEFPPAPAVVAREKLVQQIAAAQREKDVAKRRAEIENRLKLIREEIAEQSNYYKVNTADMLLRLQKERERKNDYLKKAEELRKYVADRERTQREQSLKLQRDRERIKLEQMRNLEAYRLKEQRERMLRSAESFRQEQAAEMLRAKKKAEADNRRIQARGSRVTR